MVLVEGSVPGSKNSIVTLTDAVKHNLPKEAPFPAGLIASENSDDMKDKTVQVSEKSDIKISDND